MPKSVPLLLSTKPYLILGWVLLLMVFAEVGIMLWLPALGLSIWAESLLDVALLGLVVVPVIYWGLFRPLLGALRENNRRLNQIVELDTKLAAVWNDAHFALYLCDPSSPGKSIVIIDCNPYTCELYGYTRAELVGQPIDLIETDPRRCDASNWTKLLSRVKRSTGQTHHRRKDGTLIDIEYVISLIEVDGRQLVLGMSRDVTDRMEAERWLERERLMWQGLLENVDDQIYFKDAASRFVRASNSLARKFGRESPADVIGQSDHDFFAAEHADPARQDEEDIIKSGRPILNKLEKEVRPDGGVTWALTSKVPIRDVDGTINGTCGITKDITALVESQEKVRQLSQAVEQSPATIVITDRKGQIEYTNPNFSKVTGYTAEEALGQNPRILKSGEFSRDQYKELWRTITKGNTWRGVFHNKRKNGELYWDEASISPIRDTEGQITHFLAVKMDITDRKEAEAELGRAKEAAAKAKSEFLANMSHEIRTPMNGVIGMTGILLQTELSAEQRNFAETVQDSAESLLVIINDILDFSKIEAGKLTFEEIDFDLTTVVEGAVELNAERAQKKNIELVDQIESDVPVHLKGDPGRIRQVLVNLLSNAIKFTDQGEVFLRVSLASADDKQATIRISVVDSGIGITAEAQTRLFQSFEQADNSTTRKYGGTGLGLAISRQLVTQMNGDLTVESELGKGSTFFFTIRLPKSQKPPRLVHDGLESLYNLRVLIVDDNATNRQILRHQIFAWEMQRGSAAGGHEALRLLREAAAQKQPYDLALLDMQMPEMDGMALAKAIHSDPRISATRMVMLTSLGQRFSADELQSAGLDAYLVKPVKKDLLFKTLLRVMSDAPTPRPTGDAPAKGNAGSETLIAVGLKVLLAEDNLVNQKVATTQLKRFGCDVDVVSNGQEAFDALMGKAYDLVFMDCQMPVLDGYEASRKIRDYESQSEVECRWKKPIPILAMTANAMDGDREKCLAAGMNDHVTKPVRIDKLRKALEPYVQKEASTPAALSHKT